jgi:hypothetical protein
LPFREALMVQHRPFLRRRGSALLLVLVVVCGLLFLSKNRVYQGLWYTPFC